MSAKRGERAAPPPGEGEYDVRIANNDASKGWEDLSQQVPNNLNNAWREMRTNAGPEVQTPRHSQLKYKLAEGTYKGKTYPQWQIEVTGGGRLWYLLDEDRSTCWIVSAGTGHPKATQ